MNHEDSTELLDKSTEQFQLDKSEAYETTTLMDESLQNISYHPPPLQTCYAKSPFISITVSSPDHHGDQGFEYEQEEEIKEDIGNRFSPIDRSFAFVEMGRRYSSVEVPDSIRAEYHRSSSMPRLDSTSDQVWFLFLFFVKVNNENLLSVLLNF